ncbi:RHS repeat-associated core domain-containing protein [Pseudomonas putida]|uniref:RHS repeat-associated core domain-containing protein n=1 Tax=Pseudomonas putida TaxID=303 RepID=UPI0029790476|nr:RHS repeat-associated core domain-containing protein [Pseudomonas putida]MCC9006136.1 RHS repeat-associated core domain-containing protein [Pseudomonas putida]
MKNSPDTPKYFYQTNKLTTVIGNDQKRSILRIGTLPLAESAGKEARSSQLFATDEMDSVLVVSTPDGKQNNHNYTPFGYNDKLPSGSTAMGFNGEFILDNMHLYLLGQGHRGFSTEMRRFIGPDNAESPFARGGVNAFAYCLNDPVNRKDETGMWSIFKPRTWFRSNQAKMDQRLESIKIINNTMKKETATLNNLVNKREYEGKTVAPRIVAARKNLQKTLDRGLRKERGINKYVESKDHAYIFPEHYYAKQAIKKSDLGTYRPTSGNTDRGNMLYPQKKRDDPYDDRNYQSGATDANNEIRRPKSK